MSTCPSHPPPPSIGKKSVKSACVGKICVKLSSIVMLYEIILANGYNKKPVKTGFLLIVIGYSFVN